MAALATSAVLAPASFQTPTAYLRTTTKRLTLTLTGQGIVATDTIDAATLGFTSMLYCSNAIDSADGIIVPATVDYAGAKILLANLANATDATRIAPAATTGTFRITVTGYTQ